MQSKPPLLTAKLTAELPVLCSSIQSGVEPSSSLIVALLSVMSSEMSACGDGRRQGDEGAWQLCSEISSSRMLSLPFLLA